MPSSDFTKAYSEASKLKAKPTQDEQLKIYALAKIAQGEEPKKPGAFDFAGKAKLKKYEELKGQGITAEQADKQYVETITEFKTKYGFDG